MPKEIRGVVSSSYIFCGSAGMLIFSKLGGILYDKIGSRAPFLVMSGFDCTFAIGVVLLHLCGKMK